MTIRCLIFIQTSDGCEFAEVHLNNVHQLAVLMPGSVISYDIQEIRELPSNRKIIDAELFEELSYIASGISSE